MAKCEKCGVEVLQDDLYLDNGLKVCEDCKIAGIKRPEVAFTLHLFVPVNRANNFVNIL